mmetsp:Transcript_40103/g.115708  ORF Transcript_40103/g.115708 Transcript_40103/m.115708 type:complete len:91 (+) Transcript_40103:485-757(+)
MGAFQRAVSSHGRPRAASLPEQQGAAARAASLPEQRRAAAQILSASWGSCSVNDAQQPFSHTSFTCVPCRATEQLESILPIFWPFRKRKL